jgi:hypothetical protein
MYSITYEFMSQHAGVLFSSNSYCDHYTFIKQINMRVAAPPRNQAVLEDDVMEVPEDPGLEVIEISSDSDDKEVPEDAGLG